MGRPTLYTAALAETICDRLAAGETLRAICAEEGMPAAPTVIDWRNHDRDGFSERYKRAREDQAQLDGAQFPACIDHPICGSAADVTDRGPGLDHAPRGGVPETRAKTSSWGGPRPGFGGVQPGSGRPRKAPSQPARPIEYSLGPRWYVIAFDRRDPQATMRDLSRGDEQETRIYAPAPDGTETLLRIERTTRPGYETYLPLLPVIRKCRGARTTVHLPMLAGYGLVRFDRLSDDWAPIAYCPGVRELIATRSGLPLPVRDTEVEWLRSFSEKQLGIDPERMACREKGAVVCVADGPFTSFPATVLACDGYHTTASVNIFGRETAITLPWVAFE